MYGKSVGERWWTTYREEVYNHAVKLGFPVRYNKESTERKWSVYATMNEFHNIKMTSGAYE